MIGKTYMVFCSMARALWCFKHSLCLIMIGFLNLANVFALPEAFTYLNDKKIICSINYATGNNFVDHKVDGYIARKCVMTKEAAKALVAVQRELDTLKMGYRLNIHDAYRPTDAVKHFVRWSKEPSKKHIKNKYYPDFNKPELFELGYIGLLSSHSRGSTVDLTICVYTDDSKCEELDMGTIIDLFGEKSHTDHKNIPVESRKNRLLLKEIMAKHGFKNYEKE